MDDEAQGQETGTGEATQYEAPTSFKEAFNPVEKVSEPAPSELASGFLKGLPPEDAAKLEPYIKQWDSGVSKMTEKIHADYKTQLAAFEGIDPADAQDAIELRTLIQGNPSSAIDHIKQAYLDGTISEDTANTLLEEQKPESIIDELPPEIRDRLLKTDQLESAVKELLTEREAIKAAQQEAKEIAEFHTVLETLKTEKGDYDRDTVLRLIASGMEPNEAVDKYHSLVQTAAQEKLKAHNAAPPVLGNGNIPPVDNTPVHMLSDKDRKKAVLQYLTKE